MEGLLPDLEVVRKDFPILSRTLANGQPLVYLDSRQHLAEAAGGHRHDGRPPRAAQRQHRPRDAPARRRVDRGVRGVPATRSRRSSARPTRDEVIFTKNATEALNLAANTLAWPGQRQVGPGDEIVITEMEHHSNIVPWQLLCERTGATLRWFGITDDGRLDLSQRRRPDHRAHQGRLAHLGLQHARHHQPGRRDRPPRPPGRRARGRRRLAGRAAAADRPGRDGRRRAPDLLAFTGHKVVGPTGIGVLWGRAALLDQLPPFLGGGEMIETVTMERSTYAPVPAQVRGRDAADRRGRRPRCRGRLPHRARHGRRPRATSRRSRRTRSRASPPSPG